MSGCRNQDGQFAKCGGRGQGAARGAAGRRAEVPGIERWTKFHFSHERRQHFGWLSQEGWRFDIYGTSEAPGASEGLWNLHVQPPEGAGRGWKEGPFLSRDAAVDVAKRIPEQRAWQQQHGRGARAAWSREDERAAMQRLRAQGHLQQSFIPVDYHFEWTGTGPGGWYEWDYAAAHKAARAARDAAAKSFKAAGYTVRKWSLPNSLITRGGIGSGHPQIENVVTVYMLNADRAPGRRASSGLLGIPGVRITQGSARAPREIEVFVPDPGNPARASRWHTARAREAALRVLGSGWGGFKTGYGAWILRKGYRVSPWGSEHW